jgi:hypothetical protein
MRSPDPHGQVALMLCDTLLHLLVEGRVVGRDKVIEAIEGVVGLAREMDDDGARGDDGRSALAIIESIAESFARKDPY